MSSKNLVASIPSGIHGLFGIKNLANIPYGGLIDIESIEFSYSTINKERGAIKVNNTALSGSIIGGCHYLPDGVTTRYVLFTDTGNLYKMDSSGTATLLASSLGSGAKTVVFVEGGKEGAALSKKLFIFTGVNQVKVLTGDGSTVSNIATPPTDWTSLFPTSGFIFENRLCGFGNANDPNRLYFSTQTNHEDFTGTGSLNIAVYPGDNARLSAAMPMPNGVVLFKYPRGIYFLDASDPVSSNWRIYKISDDFGVASQTNITMMGSDIYYIDASLRLKVLSVGTSKGLFSIMDVFRESKNHFEEIINSKFDIRMMEQFRVVGYSMRNEVVFSGPRRNYIYNNLRVNMDMEIGVPRFRMSGRDVCQSLWLDKNGNLMSGDKDGFVWRMDVMDVYNKDGNGYMSMFMTREYTFSEIDPALETKRKNLQFLEIEGVSFDQPINFLVEVFTDGRLSGTYNIQLPSKRKAATTIGSYTLIGPNTILSDDATFMSNAKKRITGSGVRISFRISQNGSTNWQMSKLLVHFTIGDEL